MHTHDKLEIMDTSEILRNNVYDLQKQLTTANQRIIKLHETVGDLKRITDDMSYWLQGLQIYTNDISTLLHQYDELKSGDYE